MALVWLCGNLAVLGSEPTVQFWPPPGVFTNFVGLNLSATSALIRYTLDGTEPTPASPIFKYPLLLTSTAVVKARAFQDAVPLDQWAEHSYTIVKEDLNGFASPLPIVVLSSLGQSIRHRQRIPAWMTVFRPIDERASLQGGVDFSGYCEAAIRGSSSSGRPQKPYRVEFQDSAGGDLEVSLLGLPKESDWILYPASIDRTKIRDVLAYELWRQMGYYSPRWRYVELFVVESNKNFTTLPGGSGQRPEITAGDYAGLYVLLEKIKRDKNRLDLTKLKKTDTTEPEVTGGYIFKKDRPNPGEEGFKSARGTPFVFEDPKESEIDPAQRLWLANYVNRLEEALFSDEFRDLQRGYRAFIDVESFINHHWMVELGMNFDGYGYSIYFHKDRGGKLFMGPLWDWDLTFGSVVEHGKFEAAGWKWEMPGDAFYSWYQRMFEDSDFLQRYADRWAELRPGLFSETNLCQIVDSCAAQIQDVQHRNFQRWPSFEPFSHATQATGDSYERNVEWLKNWLRARVAWIDSQGFPAPVADVEAGSLLSVREVQLNGRGGQIFYTMDGTDPRMSGGKVSSGAQKYDRKIMLGTHQRLVARVLSPYRLWSAPLVVNGNQDSIGSNGRALAEGRAEGATERRE